MEKFSAGIVLFNPDIYRLKLNIDSIISQVSIVYCYDNGSDNIDEIEILLNGYDKLLLIKSDNNVGIPVALNHMAILSKNHGISWLYTLDQDSISPENIIQKFESSIYEKDVGIICPLCIDKRRVQKQSEKYGVEKVDNCITSGSFVNLAVWESVNGFDDFLFIDLVDDEYAYRLKIHGFKILRNNDVVLDCEFGTIIEKSNAWFYIWLSDILKIEKIKSLSYERIISNIRVYYFIRNMIYLSRKYKCHNDSPFSIRKAIYFAISFFLRSNNKLDVFKSIYRGYCDGITESIRV